MATTAKAERDGARTKLKLTLRKLDGLTREIQLERSLRIAREEYDEAIRKHIAFCAKKGEDSEVGAHEEWTLSLGDLFNESCVRAEEKLETIRVANEPPEITDALKLTNAKMEWRMAECRLKADIDGLIAALETEQIGVESHKI